MRDALEDNPDLFPGRAHSDIVATFPLARLTDRENLLSLLHYFGLLRIRDVVAGVPRLGIPNQTVRRRTYGFLRDAYRDVGVFSLNLVEFDRLARGMALEGDWRPAVERLYMAAAEQARSLREMEYDEIRCTGIDRRPALSDQYTGVRDYIQGEKVLQGFLAA